MAEETWHAARLIPTSGINGAEEQERRATSAVLAVMTAVREFGQAMTKPFGAPSGAVEAFIEVPFEVDGKRVFPDGLVRVTRGAKTWTALVEVKTGTNALGQEQVERYLDVARAEGFDALITISNDLAPTPGTHPTTVDKRKLKKVALHHLSWTEVLSLAIMQKVHRGVADPDQAWILGELIRYLEHDRSGALGVTDMGDAWVKVRDAVEDGTIRPTDAGVAQVVTRWEQLVRYACLTLGQSLGVEVQPVLSRKEVADPGAAVTVAVATLVESGLLRRDIRIPGGVAPLTLEADLRAQRVSCSLTIDGPKVGRPQTRVNWLLRQLSSAPDSLRIDTFVVGSRAVAASELLATAREDPTVLVTDPGKVIRAFRLVHSTPMGAKRGKGRGTFIGSVLQVLDDFYDDTAQHLKPWSAAAPRPRDISDEVDQEAAEQGVARSLVSADVSSQDGPEVDGADPAFTALPGEPPLREGMRRVRTSFRAHLRVPTGGE
ncbi:MAG TPA: hypothetical protein VFU19_06870 [Iamia sp.]|nr:hypothetical protein [Iamia sp.]